MTSLQNIIETFQGVDPQMRLEMLLDFSKRLPALPERFHAQRDEGHNRVHECQTPVFLWVETDDDRVHIYVDVAEDAPTVKGFLGILIKSFNGASTEELAAVPSDLLHQLGLADHIRMTRAVGLSAILARIKHAACA